MKKRGLKLIILTVIVIALCYTPCLVSTEGTHYLELNSPGDIVIIPGSTNQAIVWSPTSDSYAEYTLEHNSVEIDSGTWYGGNISVSLDELEIGIHIFTLEMKRVILSPPNVTGTYMLYATDTVQVTVLDPGQDILIVMVLALGLVALSILILKRLSKS